MNKFVIRFSLCFIMTLAPAYAETIPGEQILSAFSASCKSQGQWTQAALSHAKSVINILTDLRDDDDCRTLSGALYDLNTLSTRITEIEVFTELDVDLAKLKAQEQSLMTQILQSSSPDIIYTLQTTLATVQSDINALITRNNHERELRNFRLSNGLYHAISNANAIMNQAIANKTCLEKRSSLFPALTSLAGSLSSAALLVNPTLSLGLAGGSQILNTLVDAFRRGRLSSQIGSISDGTTKTTAFSCVLEALSDRWCEAHDAILFIKSRAQSLAPQRTPRQNDQQALLKAIRYSNREIPVLLEWLEQVRAGADAATTAGGMRARSVINDEASLRGAEKVGIAYLTENRFLFDDTASDDKVARFEILRTLLKNMLDSAGVCNGGCPLSRPTGPLLEIFGRTRGLYFLIGMDPATNINGEFINFDAFNPFTDNPGYVPDIQVAFDQFEAWVQLAKDRVQSRLINVLQPDALALISRAYNIINSPLKVSPKKSLENMIGFLKKYQPTAFITLAFKKIYVTTLEKLQKINRSIEGAVMEDQDPKQALTQISEEANLSFGSILLRDRLELVIQVAITNFIKNQDPTNRNDFAQLMASNNYFDLIKQISGKDNLSSILSDLNKAQVITQNTLREFSEVFDKEIRHVLEENLELERETPGSSGEVYRKMRAEICYGLLASTHWPKRIPKKLCQGLGLQSPIPGGPSSPTITDETYKLPHHKRACYFRNFLRESKIYEDWGIRL